MRIVFVRHGEPDYANDCLTEAGKVQAAQAAQRLRSEGISEIWSSPFGRAMETAKAASEVLGLPVKTLDCMHELYWGSTDDTPIFGGGHPWNIADEMARLGISLNRPDWRDSPFFRTNRVTENVDLVEKGIDEWLASYGYLREGCYYRHTVEEEEHRSVALFSHGGSSCAAIGHILDLPFPYACALLHFEFTGITVIRMDRKAGPGSLPCLELCNDAKHIHEAFYHRLADK